VADKFVVQTVLKGKDLLTPVLRRNAKAVGLFGTVANRSFDKATKKAMGFKSVMGGILAAGAVSRGLNLMRMGVEGVTREFIDFDAALTQAGAKFPQRIGRGTAAFEELGKTARRVGAETKFSAADAARGLDFLAMAGFNAEQAMVSLPGVTDLAVIANTDLARATDIASDALGAFGLQTKDTAQLQKNLARVNDAFAHTVTSSNTDLEQLFETMKFAGPVIKASGSSIETFTTLAGVMANAGIKASLSGTALRAAFIRLIDPPKEARVALNKLKVSMRDENKEARDMLDVLGELRTKTNSMTKAQRLSTLSRIFGRRAVAGMQVVLSKTGEELKLLRKQTEEASGAGERMGDMIQQSLENRLLELRSAAIELGFNFLEAFSDRVEKGIKGFIKAIREFDPKPLVKDLKDFVRTVIQVKNAVVELWPFIKGAGTFLLGVATAFKAVAAATWLWNVALAANPIGLVIAGLAALIGTLVWAYHNWDDIVNFMSVLWIDLRNTVLDAIDWIGRKFLELVNSLIGAAQKLGYLKDVKLFDTDVFRAQQISRENELLRAQAKLTGAVTNEEIKQRKERARQQQLIGLRQQQSIIPGQSDETNQLLIDALAAPSSVEVPQVGFKGELNIAGAPKGSTFKSKTRGAPPIKTEMLGAQ
jgi:TP901 family phage tail tape measure protein